MAQCAHNHAGRLLWLLSRKRGPQTESTIAAFLGCSQRSHFWIWELKARLMRSKRVSEEEGKRGTLVARKPLYEPPGASVLMPSRCQKCKAYRFGEECWVCKQEWSSQQK